MNRRSFARLLHRLAGRRLPRRDALTAGGRGFAALLATTGLRRVPVVAENASSGGIGEESSSAVALAQVARSRILQWSFIGGGATLEQDAPVTLRNLQENESVRYGDRDNGIELVWDAATDLGNVTILSEAGGSAPITYASPVALRFTNGGFVRYAEQDRGINLDWTASPRYEWEITGGRPGTPVSLNDPVALLNTEHGDHLIYDERIYGINLRWYADLDVDIPNGNWVVFGGYPPLPIPRALRAPSREAAQIQVNGLVDKVSLFHGRSDDELDWHFYVSLDPGDLQALTNHLPDHARGGSGIEEQDLEQQYCELMVLDGWRNTLFDEHFLSSDVTRAFELAQPAWDISRRAGDNQGDNIDLTSDSRLGQSRARISMQGAFVNDAEYGFKTELHPLDSIAYALSADGVPLTVAPDHADWPETELTWRVAVFTNSTFHRIDNADYLEQERETLWLLPLPRAAERLNQTEVTVVEPGFTNRALGDQGLDDARSTPERAYARYGVLSAEHALTPRDAAGRRFLRVAVRMAEPDRWGGMFLAEYRIRVRSGLLEPILHVMMD